MTETIATPRRRSRLDLALVLAAAVAIGGLSFAGGRLTASAATSAAAAQNCGTGNTGGGVPGAPEPAGGAGGGGG